MDKKLKYGVMAASAAGVAAAGDYLVLAEAQGKYLLMERSSWKQGNPQIPSVIYRKITIWKLMHRVD